MSPAAQIIVAIGVAGLLLMLGSLGIIWGIRCDPKRSHYRLPALVALGGPISIALFALAKLH
jgi:hypothetical protein